MYHVLMMVTVKCYQKGRWTHLACCCCFFLLFLMIMFLVKYLINTLFLNVFSFIEPFFLSTVSHPYWFFILFLLSNSGSCLFFLQLFIVNTLTLFLYSLAFF